MWTPTTREQHSRPTTRYQTDLTDAERRLIEHRLPAARRTGRPRSWSMREIVNAMGLSGISCQGGHSGKKGECFPWPDAKNRLSQMETSNYLAFSAGI